MVDSPGYDPGTYRLRGVEVHYWLNKGKKKLQSLTPQNCILFIYPYFYKTSEFYISKRINMKNQYEHLEEVNMLFETMKTMLLT
ncbi:MAG: hypothetical protein OQL19_17700 [Gammaproteobacteria bacterium]|nr:hypothetical protein [Gammaproteobacteria bacterium]